MNRLALVVLLMLFSPSVGAATLAGFVRDEATGQPIVYASVRLDTPTRATLSDNRGAFWLNRLPVGTCQLTVSAVGYKTRV